MYGYTQSGAEAKGTSFANLTGYPIPPGFSRTIIPSLLFGSLITATDPGMELTGRKFCSTAFPHPNGTLASCPPPSPSLHMPPGEKQSGEQSQICLGLFPKTTGEDQWDCEIVRSTSFTTVKFVHLHSSIRTFFELVFHKIFWALQDYTVTKHPLAPRNLTWFTRLFHLVRGWGLGTRLMPPWPCSQAVL